MKFLLRSLIIPFLFLLALPAAAQSIQFTADVTQGNGQVTPVLTWDTTPLADDCVAGGDWSGNKGGAGTETLATITSSATYNLTCTWINDSVTLTWTPPTQNTDDSALTDLASYNIYFGSSPGGPYSNTDIVTDANANTHIVSGLPVGAWYFVATAVNSLGIESDLSNEAMKLIDAIGGSESIGIVVNPVPNAPTNLGVL